MFNKILIANRGEIAVRVIRACRELGTKAVAIYSDVDRESLHVRFADEAYYAGKPPAAESYLNIDNIMETAKKAGAEAVHPGYGFLAENAAFAERCADEGIVFIGPSPQSIRDMGDKLTARDRMTRAGVPVVPGNFDALKDADDAMARAEEMGFPVMLKAAAGGGGKGMRLVRNPEDLKSAFRGASSEAGSAFGNPSVYIEKFVEHPRHIEIQVLADGKGNTVHLGERECSIQRRHQKVIEECPSPMVDEEMRERMGKIAVRAAEAVDYVGAGTVEFLADREKNFYFLEMNTRVQVEHPVTEMVWGVDIVKEQINIAAGAELSISQDELSMRGAAIECRIYAEDPDNNFLPSPGLITGLRLPGGPGIRNDNGVHDGFRVPAEYDPMISKLIACGKDRNEAIQRMRRALEEYKIRGIKTTIKFHEKVMFDGSFIRGDFDTDYIDKVFLRKEEDETETADVALIAAAICRYNTVVARSMKPDGRERVTGLWKSAARRESTGRD